MTKMTLEFIKMFIKKKTLNLIYNDPSIGEDKLNDHNNIENLMVINYSLRTSQVVIVLTVVSYFIGIFWFIFCDLCLYF
jgi:hypothetical protein